MLSSQIAIVDDDMFDLDLALTMPEVSAEKRRPDAESTAAARLLVGAMPEVSAGAGAGNHCVVCMEEFGNEETGKRIPCGHVFHEGCISDWLSLHNACPLCRRTLAL
ncbi:E3 ubiquitin-protein ligase MPSR1-like [Andrographis paniculata]|uniref:E3 ubiquitin-protein ligase MPSR1-like n=1 Tax=Andrographis paniculata TaxID=175694 RepID=UPI0021E8099B|nr:E3 ubiquitin-protein ligase MPSR1-like [Andrographis paniculata]